MRTINNERTNRCKSYFSKLILNELEGINCWIAGGAIRTWYANEKRSDIDLFFANNKDMVNAQNRILHNGGEPVFENDNVTKIRYKNQIFDFVKKHFQSPESTISEFDFTVTMAAVTVTDSYFGDSFFMDLSSKRLAINKLPFPSSTVFRLQKYHQKGYFICKEELSKIIVALQGIDIATIFNADGTINTNEIMQSDSGLFAGMD